ncbi:hypothetical protein ACF05T_22925 [Streptomyces lateritius]|uniref:Uncharacterized protein n=1 Tax=Streptomyces lateritius TaxID=67313 RepID=A0ABW6YGH3_9ACTN
MCDEGRAFAARPAEAGGAVPEDHHPGVFHGFPALVQYLEAAARALSGAADAIASRLSGRKNSGDHGGLAG